MSQKFESDRPTIEEIRRLKRPNERSVSLVLDPEVSRNLKELERSYLREKRIDDRENRNPKAPAIAKAIEQLKDSAEEITFTFRDIGRKRFDAMIDEHPPTKEEKEQNFQFHPDTFAPALLAATAVEPTMTPAEAQAIYDEWGQGEVNALFMTAIAACTERASIPFSKSGTDEILDSLSSSITPQVVESLTDGSLAGPTSGATTIEQRL